MKRPKKQRRCRLETLEPRLVLDSTVVFNEIMYNPLGQDESAEWIELHNQMGVDMDISGWRLDAGVEFSFPLGTVIPGRGYLVVAADPAAFENETGVSGAFGPYVGSLNNGGETLELVNNNDRVMDAVDFGDGGFWPVAADGSGATLAKRDPNTASEPAASWTISSQVGGTPGELNFTTSEAKPVTSTLISSSAIWSYEDTDTALDSAWKDPSFDAAAWPAGRGPLFAGEVAIGNNEALVGYWNFDDNVDDQSDAGNNGVLNGASYASNVPAAIGAGKSLDFGSSGDGNNVLIPAAASLNSSVFTLSMFINDRGQASAINRLISRAGDSFELGLNKIFAPANGQLSIYSSAGGGWQRSLTTPTLNTWQHVALVSSGTQLEMFVDGVSAWTIPLVTNPTGNLRIGSRENGPDEGFNGLIDDVALWNVALPESAIAELAQGNASPLTVSVPQVVTKTVTSNLSDWRISTESIDGGAAGTWFPTADPLPDVSTFTIVPSPVSGAVIGNINTAADGLGVTGLAADANVRYYRTTFELDAFSNISATLQLAIDNGAQVYLNGQLIATETSFVGDNWALPLPTVSIAAGGAITTTKFDSAAANFSGWRSGENELIIAVRNPNSEVSPAGGFALRMDVQTVSIGGNTQLALGPPTYYLRQEFEFDDDPALTTLSLTSLVDDGAVFYLNGQEVLRRNMPGGGVTHSTLATSSIDVATFSDPVAIPTDRLLRGTNVLAVEVHQAQTVDPDMLFAATLKATVSPPPPTDEIDVVFNEAAPATDVSFWLELANEGQISVDVGGFTITSSDQFAVSYVLPSQTLAPGGLLVVNESDLGFSPASGDKLFLATSGNTAVLDGIGVTNRLRGRSVEQQGRWLWPAIATPGGSNEFDFNTDIVINEIMYNPRSIAGSTGTPATFETDVLIAMDDQWRYNAAGDLLSADWPSLVHPLGGNWQQGPGLIGFEDEALPAPGIQTTVDDPLDGIGPYITTYYFEREFELTAEDIAAIDQLQLLHIVDDGAVFYINGTEVTRFDMPAGPISATTLSSGGGEASQVGPLSISKSSLVVGTNRISVEVHQTSLTSSDIVFGLQLTAARQLTAAIPGEPFQKSDEQWLELTNRGAASVDLSGWRFSDGISYEFPSGTTLAPGEFLVVAKDSAALLADYPGIRVVGDFGGRLSRAGERIELRDAANNPADIVEYFDEGKWDPRADGGGSSLELRDTDADNSVAQAWAASDEAGRSSWQTVTYRGIARASAIGPDAQWKELHLGLLDAGEVLIDDIQVIQDPAGAAIPLLQNGTFESDQPGELPAAWRLLGTHGSHGRSLVITDPDDPGNQVLRLIATGATESIYNNAQTTFAGGASIINGVEYEITYRAKPISGSTQLNTRLYFNRLPKTTSLEVSPLGGTPGEANSRAESNIGPTYQGLIHGPAVPSPGQDVNVTVTASDSDGVANMTLWYSVAGGSFVSVAMASGPMASAGDDRYGAAIPGQSAGTVVQFYVEGEDALGATSTFPAAGADSRALIQFDDGRAVEGQKLNLRMIMTAADSDFMLERTNVMSNDRMGSTVVYDENTVFYDVGVRIKGSERGRHDVRMSFNLRFQPDRLFRGVQPSIAIDRSGAGDQTSQKEILVKHIVNRAGGVPGAYDDLIQFISPRDAHTGSAMLMMTRYRNDYLDAQFDNGSDGLLYEYELVYYPRSTVDGNPESLKLYYPTGPDGVIGTSIRDMGDDQENYRYTFLQKNNRERDDYERIIEFAKSFSLSGAAFLQQSESMIDVDQWLRAFAVTTLAGIGDNYATGAAHNLMLYVRPDDQRVMFFPHDMDFSFSAGATSGLVQNGDLNKLLASPANRRAYYGHILDIVTTTFNATYMSPWVSYYDSLLPAESLAGFASYIATRSNFALGAVNSAIPAVSFDITTGGGNAITVAESGVDLEGTGWVNVREIRLSGSNEPLQVTWTGADRWQTRVPVGFGPNNVTLEAYDFQGNLIASDTIVVTSTVSDRPLQNFLRITELHYNPPGGSDATEFVELQNISDTFTLDLTGVRLTDGPSQPFDFTGSGVTSLSPGEFVLVVKDQAAFELAYPQVDTAMIAGEYVGSFSNGGENIRLVDADDAVILEFEYQDGDDPGEEAWHVTTDGDGFSLVIIDPLAESTRWGNGTAWRPSHELGGSPGVRDLMLGDLNDDSRVGLTDVAIEQAYFGAAQSRGDLNGDGAVTRKDVVLMVRNFGRSYDPPAPSPAAAPSALVVGQYVEPISRSDNRRQAASLRSSRNGLARQLVRTPLDVALADEVFARSVRFVKRDSIRASRSQRAKRGAVIYTQMGIA